MEEQQRLSLYLMAVLFKFQLLFQRMSFNVEPEAFRWELLFLLSEIISHYKKSKIPKALVLDKLLFAIAKGIICCVEDCYSSLVRPHLEYWV